MSYVVGPAPYYNVTYGGLDVEFPSDYFVDQPYLQGSSGIEQWIISHGYNLVNVDGHYHLEGGTYNPPPISGCFIATASYGTPLHKDLDILRRFRDERLPDELVDLYYRSSPPVARVISQSKVLRWIVRQPLKVIVWILSHS